MTISARGRPQRPSNAGRARRCPPALLLALGVFLPASLSDPAAAADPPARMLVLPIKLLDTSAEPDDQTAAHARRLEQMGADLSTDITASRLYKAVEVGTDTVRTACPVEEPGCLLELARTRGAEVVFIGVVHKSSSLIMQMWARLVDARTGKEIFSRDLNFRGDTDEAWRRAQGFLISQIKAASEAK